MRRTLQVALIILTAGAAAGCGASRPVKYYVLDASAAPAAASPTQYPVRLSIGHISTSYLYRDDRLVFGSGPVQLGTYEYERWAESPAEMMQDLLVKSLRQTGQYTSVSKLGSTSRGDYIVRGHLDALYEVDQPELLARFSIRVELYDPKSGDVVWLGSYSHDEPANGKSVASVVEAMSHNVQAGMQRLTSQIGDYFASHPPKQS
jgi:ABC-type uncharacterized transport system auxiliary subunit